MKMDFSHADRADSDKLNLILWQDAMGKTPPPAQLLVNHAKKKDDETKGKGGSPPPSPLFLRQRMGGRVKPLSRSTLDGG